MECETPRGHCPACGLPFVACKHYGHSRTEDVILRCHETEEHSRCYFQTDSRDEPTERAHDAQDPDYCWDNYHERAAWGD